MYLKHNKSNVRLSANTKYGWGDGSFQSPNKLKARPSIGAIGETSGIPSGPQATISVPTRLPSIVIFKDFGELLKKQYF